MRVIVTGGCGFIGSSFVHLLSKLGIEYRVVDSLTYAGSMNHLPKGFDLLVKDICDVEETDLGEYDYVVNFAAESHVDRSIQNGAPFIKSNIQGLFNLIEVTRKNKNLKKFIHISTDEVYGDLFEDFPSLPAKTSHPLRGSSYYSASKASADLLVQAAGRMYNIPYLITRTCNNFGERQNKEKFLPTVISSIKNNLPIPIYGDGKNIREWIYVEDNVKCILELMQDSNATGIFNIGSNQRYTNLDIVKIIEEVVGKKVEIDYIEDRKGHDRLYALDSSETPYLTHTKSLKAFLQEQFNN